MGCLAQLVSGKGLRLTAVGLIQEWGKSPHLEVSKVTGCPSRPQCPLQMRPSLGGQNIGSWAVAGPELYRTLKHCLIGSSSEQ